MANICENVFTVKGRPDAVSKFIEDVSSSRWAFDVDKIMGSEKTPSDLIRHPIDEVQFEQYPEDMFGEVRAEYRFYTKWDTPYQVYAVLASRYKNLYMAAVGVEPGCDYYYKGDNHLGTWQDDSRSLRRRCWTRQAMLGAWMEHVEDPKSIDWQSLINDKEVYYDIDTLDTDSASELRVFVVNEGDPQDIIRKHTVKN